MDDPGTSRPTSTASGRAASSPRGRVAAVALPGDGKEVAFTLFERYDLEGAEDPERPSYAQLAAETGLPVTQVTNHLHWARREFRAAVLENLREITASEAEFRAEARALLGVDPP